MFRELILILEIIFVLILVFAIVFYFKNFITKSLNVLGIQNDQIKKYLPWSLIILSMILIFLTRSTVGIIIFAYLLLACLVIDLINRLVKFISKNESFEKYFYILAIILVICSIIWPIYGFIEIDDVQVTNYTYETSKNLNNNTIKILMLSDLHMGTTLNIDQVNDYIIQMNDTHPDLILLVGDIFDESTSSEEMIKVSELLGKINSTYGIFYVFGNHDQLTYTSQPEFTKEEIKANLTKNNIIVLEDEKILVNDSFYIIGRQDNSFSDKKRASIEELTKDVDASKFIILLDHQPLDSQNASKYGVDLQFSGHTHGGQIWPIRPISEFIGMYDIIYGNKTIDNYELIASSGIGAWGYPVRTGSFSEYVITTVNSVK